jgi:isopentenyldiphosphate isomerase
MTNVTFVDEHDNILGYGTREEALKKGLMRRIVEVIVTNSKGEVLMQKRSPTVLLDPGKWDTSVGGHVDEGEERLPAALRETEEELGITGVTLTPVATFSTEMADERGTSRRLVTLYSTVYDGPINFDKNDVSDVQWIQPEKLIAWMQESPNDFSFPFVKSFEIFMKKRPDAQPTGT